MNTWTTTSADELAHAAGIDRFRLTRLFQRAFGTSPHAYWCACCVPRAGCWRPAARPRRRPRTSASPTRAIWAAGSAARTGSRRPLTGNSAQTFQTDRARQPIMSVSTRSTHVRYQGRADRARRSRRVAETQCRRVFATGVAAEAPEALGEPYEDAAGRRYGRMLGQPMLVFSADLNGLQAAHRQALSREPRSCPTCTRCFRPGTTRPTATCFAGDAENLDFVGLALRGRRRRSTRR